MNSVEFDIIYYSESWHAGTRLDCDDALKKGYRAMRHIDLANVSNCRFELVSAHAGNTVNMHPSQCEFRVIGRYDEPETPKTVAIQLKNILNLLLEQDSNMKYELKII